MFGKQEETGNVMNEKVSGYQSLSVSIDCRIRRVIVHEEIADASPFRYQQCERSHSRHVRLLLHSAAPNREKSGPRNRWDDETFSGLERIELGNEERSRLDCNYTQT